MPENVDPTAPSATAVDGEANATEVTIERLLMAEYSEKALFSGVPSHLIEGLAQYIVRGVPTGSFLQAALSNDLKDAFGRADSESRLGMYAIVRFICNDMPHSAQGSRKTVAAWIAAGGQLGKRASKASPTQLHSNKV